MEAVERRKRRELRETGARKRIEELERKIAALEKAQAALAKRIDKHIKTTTLSPEELLEL